MSRLWNHHVSIFVILLMKMVVPFLMLLSPFSWIRELMKNRLNEWKCHYWVCELTKNNLYRCKCCLWICELMRCNLCEWKCHKCYFSNIVDSLKAMSLIPYTCSKLKSFDSGAIIIEFVNYLPTKFNGDILFELPPIRHPLGHYGQLQGMDKKFDGHV